MNRMLLATLSVGAAHCVTPTLYGQLGQQKFIGMDKPPPGLYGQSDGMLIYAIDDDGSVFGTNFGTPCAWQMSTKYTSMKPLVIGGYAKVDSVTTNEGIMFGIASDTPANSRAIPVRWATIDSLPNAIKGFPANWGCESALCNANGKVVAGYAYEQKTGGVKAIFIWRAGVRKNMGWEFITEFPAGVIYAGINDLSDDGTIGVGGGPDATLEGFSGIRWTKQSGLQLVPDISGGINDASFIACDATGFRASHWASPPEGKWIAAVWDPVNSWSLLGKLKPTDIGSGLMIDKSGFAGVGTSHFGTIPEGRTAIYWTARDGIRSVQDVLVTDYGLTEANAWKLGDVDAISPNGRYMAGRGLNPQGKFETWWAEIRPFCYADCDDATSPKGKNAGAPVLDIDDFICYQTKFILGDHLYADCDLNGVINIDDFICFQTKFVLGCP